MGDSESTKNTFRPMITGPNMYSLLIREFARVKPAECTRCRVPLPFWGPAPGKEAVYWYMQAPAACPHGCGQLLAKLWAKLTTEYKIAPPEKESVQWEHGIRVTVAQG
jgi:hypothetical protein